jgi:hypothetical protein
MQRTFRETEFDPNTTEKRPSARRAFPATREDLSWESMLENPRILLIAEAGAGKTHECRRQAELMFERGDAAFFLRLETAAAHGVAGSLRKKQLERFLAWQASSSQPGYFFLDSVDELQLIHVDFRDALTRLADDLEGALGRAFIIVTSRPVPFDREAFSEILPMPQRDKREVSGDKFVQMAMRETAQDEEDLHPRRIKEFALRPLDDRQILTLATEQQVASPEGLLAEIKRTNSEDLARWPQELIELCADWRTHGIIRPKRHQLESHIASRLTARLNRPELADLPLSRARDGAQRLALTVMLCRRWTFRYSASADQYKAGEPPIDPATLLADFNVREIAALLERPLFGDGGYGRAQFRHRSVLEYLAACQLDSQIGQGTMTPAAAKRMLFGLAADGARLTKPSMRPVAAWLSLLRPEIFEALLQVDPGTLLIEGDPESLSQGQCERALTAYVGRYGNGTWRGIDVPRLQIARLAKKPLAGVVLSLWSTGVKSPEVRQLLLQLISSGRYTECADLVAEVAADSTASNGDRFEAIVALTNLSDGRAADFIEETTSNAVGWPRSIGRGICSHFYPKHVSDDQFLAFLAEDNHRSAHEVDYTSTLARAIEAGSIENRRLRALLPRLMDLVRPAAFDDDDEIIERKGRPRACGLLRSACVRLLRKGKFSEDVLRASVVAHFASGTRYDRRNESREIPKLLRGLDSSQRLFVLDCEYEQILERQPETEIRALFTELAHDAPLILEADDQRWILKRLSDASGDSKYRAVLLFLSVYLAPRDDGNLAGTKAILRAVKDSPRLVSQLEQRIADSLPDPQFIEVERKQKERTARQKKKREQERSDWITFWRALAKHPSKALRSDMRERTIWNLSIALRNKPRSEDEARWGRAFLEEHFGAKAIDSLRSALMGYWRSMTPSLRTERKDGEKDTYLVVWSIGLMGIYAEAEDGDWAAKLTSVEAELAVRYALLELNGYPSWLPALAEEHPDIVEQALGDAIDAELSETGGSGTWRSSSLQSLQYGRREIASRLQQRLVKWLLSVHPLMSKRYTPEFGSKLEQVTGVLLMHGDEHARTWLAELALRHAGPLSLTQHLLFWLPVLCQTKPHRGLAQVLRALERLPVEPNGTAVALIGGTQDERSNSPQANWRANLSAMERLDLLRAVYRHVSPETDNVHVGVYSPDNRDRAEDGRRNVFAELMDAEGPGATEAKMALADDPTFAHLRSRIETMAQERLAKEIDTSTFEPTELAGLLAGKELSPKSGSEMAQLMIDRLEEMKDLMLQDTSPRKAWAETKDENTLRPVIAREFQTSAQGAYTVDQESVTADGKETDIRLRAIAGPLATIELKIGEKDRSAKELRDTIENQLVNKYMAPKDARSGCLLVTVANPGKTWKHPDDGRAIDRFGLQELLGEAAQQAQTRLGGDARVIACVLDLTPRLGTEASASLKSSKKPGASRGRARTKR